MKKVLAFDLGGTKFAFGVVAENGEVLGSDKIETLAKQGPEQAIHRVNLAAQSLIQKLNIKPTELIGIGIASPGPLDISKGCVDGSPNLPGWSGYSIERGLSNFFNLPCLLYTSSEPTRPY